MNIRNSILTGMAALGLLGAAVPSASAFDIPVATEILLLADVSGSVDDADFLLQRAGYAAAFHNASVQNAILANGPIAVRLVYWAESQAAAGPWTYISTVAESDAFADAIAGFARPFGPSLGTGLADALTYGSTAFANNGFEGQRQVIDVSGDGADSEDDFGVMDAVHVRGARDQALANGVDTINALWIDDRDFFGDDPTDLINALDYGNLNVIAGTGQFQDIVQDFPEFEAAIINKIGKEVIPNVPDGGATAGLLCLGLVTFGFFRRHAK